MEGMGQADEVPSELIRSSLPTTYKYDFLDGFLDCEPSKELSQVYEGPYYCYCATFNESAIEEAIDYVRGVVEEDGPFDAIMGFSQGAALAAAFLARHELERPLEAPPFRLAVFICASLVPPAMVASKYEGWLSSLGLGQATGSQRKSITIPTVHVVGRKDPCYEEGLRLAAACSEEKMILYDHGMGHEIPRKQTCCDSIGTAVQTVAGRAFMAC